MLEGIKEYDKSFNESLFLTKVDHVFIMLLTAIMERDISSVKHYLSDSLYEKYNKEVEEDINNNRMRIFDESNVKSTDIIDYEVSENEISININLVSRYMDYYMDLDGNFISGVNDHRKEVLHHITFTKRLDTKELGEVRRCPSCGHSLDINNSGKCNYCNQIIDMSNYDYIITKIDNL